MCWGYEKKERNPDWEKMKRFKLGNQRNISGHEILMGLSQGLDIGRERKKGREKEGAIPPSLLLLLLLLGVLVFVVGVVMHTKNLLIKMDVKVC